MDYLPTWPEDYAVGNYRTSQRSLMRSLGSFWTSVFADKGTLKGYTLGMAEELIQSYYNLVEVVDSYAVDKVHILHRERWSPLVVTKSAYNQAPFTFSPAAGVFGVQPALDTYYAGQLFKFGQPKDSSGNIYSFTPPANFAAFSIIADRIAEPTSLYVNGIDVKLENNELFFNTDVFSNPNVAHFSLVSDLGEAITYIDANGRVVPDEFIILWAYNAGLDTANIQNNFGTIFELEMTSSLDYKRIMQAVVALYAGGPTIRQYAAIVSAFLGIELVSSNQEQIESVYTDNLGLHVITSRKAYLFDARYSLSDKLTVGSIVNAGTQLTDAVFITDAVSGGTWWYTDLSTPKISFPNHLFTGNYTYQLFFDNALRDVYTDQAGDIVFPVSGNADDILEFHRQMNAIGSRAAALQALGLSKGGKNTINPVAYLFENFFKNNTTLLKVKFLDLDQLERFFSFSYVLREHTPAHVYLLYLIDLALPQEAYIGLNSRLVVEGFKEDLAVDGSSQRYIGNAAVQNASAFLTNGSFSCNTADAALLTIGQQVRFQGDLGLYTIVAIDDPMVTFDKALTLPNGTHTFDAFAFGGRPTYEGDTEYYKAYTTRLFTAAQAPTINNPPEPLYVPSNLSNLTLSGNSGPRVSSGKVLTTIPVGATTKEISSLLLIDFS